MTGEFVTGASYTGAFIGEDGTEGEYTVGAPAVVGRAIVGISVIGRVLFELTGAYILEPGAHG